MKDTLKIGKCEYKVLVAWGVLVKFAENHGIKDISGLDLIAKMELTEIAQFIAECIVAGERAEGRTCEVTAEKLSEEMTLANVKEFYSILAEQVAGGEVAPVKKKRIFAR